MEPPVTVRPVERPFGEAVPIGRSPLTFFALVFALAVPFWLLGAIVKVQLMPGLPIAALMFFVPGLAGLILAWREGGVARAGALARRAVDFRKIRPLAWLAPILLLMPAVGAAAFAVTRMAGAPIPAPRIEFLPTLGLCLVFLVAAIGEELGWSGYAIDPLQKRWGALTASLMLGAVWAVFHYVALLQAQRSLAWIAWWSFGTVAIRVLIVWLYDNMRGSVAAAALFHMSLNVTWQLYPIHGSWFDPRVQGLILAMMAVIVVIVWGPQTLTRRPV